LQRDPIGIRGGTNVFAYVGNIPTIRIDAFGLIPMDDPRYPPIPRPEGKGPYEVYREVRDKAIREGKGDKWAHYMLNYRLVEEVPGGYIIAPVVSIFKEFADLVYPPRDWMDSLFDLVFDAIGYWDALSCSHPRM
jgi:hypothetical protein